MPPKKSGKTRKAAKTSAPAKKSKLESALIDSNEDAELNKHRRSNSVSSAVSSESDDNVGAMSKFQDFDVEQAIKDVDEMNTHDFELMEETELHNNTESSATANIDNLHDGHAAHTHLEQQSEQAEHTLNAHDAHDINVEHNGATDNGNNNDNEEVAKGNEEETIMEKYHNNVSTNELANNNLHNNGNEHNSENEAATVVHIQPEEVVSLEAIAALEIPRSAEAHHGLLAEPTAPRQGIPRVTRDDESAPALPTELMQLLSA